MPPSPDLENRGGRRATGQGTPVMVRVHDPLLQALDAVAADQPEPAPGRPEAVRRALTHQLRAKGHPQASKRAGRSADADPEEHVIGGGPMTPRGAVRGHVAARERALETGGALLTTVAREVAGRSAPVQGSDPAVPLGYSTAVAHHGLFTALCGADREVRLRKAPP